MVRLRSGFVLLALMMLACGGGGQGPSHKASAPNAKLRQRADMILASPEGTHVPVPDGKKVIVEVWSPSCVSCKEHVAEILKRSEQINRYGAKLVLVAVLSESETSEAAKATLASWGVNAPFLVDRGGALKDRADVQTAPATIVLTSAGTLHWVSPPDATADDAVRASF